MTADSVLIIITKVNVCVITNKSERERVNLSK